MFLLLGFIPTVGISFIWELEDLDLEVFIDSVTTLEIEEEGRLIYSLSLNLEVGALSSSRVMYLHSLYSGYFSLSFSNSFLISLVYRM